MTAVTGTGVTLSLICDDCGRIEPATEPQRSWTMVWPVARRAGWTGGPLAVGEHYCPCCRVGTTARPAVVDEDAAPYGAATADWVSAAELDGVLVVALRGELDRSRQPELARHLSAAGASAGVLLNMSNVDSVDSSVLGVLVDVWQRLAASGRTIGLVRPSPRIRRILELLCLAELFPVYATLEDGIRATTAARRRPVATSPAT